MNTPENTNRPPPEKPLLEELAHGLRKRTWVTARLASKLGAKAMRAVRGKDGNAVAEELALENATKLVAQIEGLKGLVLKVGQMASYLPGALPENAQRVLSQLQAQTTAMSWEKVAAVIESEMGAPPETLFDHIETRAFAAASIGQVHRARLAGREVAVKIQYPGIEKILQSDLKTIGLFVRLSMVGTATDGKAVVGELAERLLEECDYRREMANQQLFARLFSAYPNTHVPAPIPERTSTRVFTSEFVDARSFSEFCDTASQDLRDQAGQTIFRTCYDSIFRHCIYNADPHPGNYLFLEDGRVSFLDFGCVRAFETDMIDTWKRAAVAVVDGDRAGFERHFIDLGIVGKPRKFDWDYHWEVIRYLYKPFLQREPYFTFTDDYVRQSYDLMIFQNPNRKIMVTPPAWLFLQRLQWGLNAVLARLNATGPWPEIWREAITSPTQPVRR